MMVWFRAILCTACAIAIGNAQSSEVQGASDRAGCAAFGCGSTNGRCQCSEDCVLRGDCCDDFRSVCSETAPSSRLLLDANETKGGKNHTREGKNHTREEEPGTNHTKKEKKEATPHEKSSRDAGKDASKDAGKGASKGVSKDAGKGKGTDKEKPTKEKTDKEKTDKEKEEKEKTTKEKTPEKALDKQHDAAAASTISKRMRMALLIAACVLALCLPITIACVLVCRGRRWCCFRGQKFERVPKAEPSTELGEAKKSEEPNGRAAPAPAGPMSIVEPDGDLLGL